MTLSPKGGTQIRSFSQKTLRDKCEMNTGDTTIQRELQAHGVIIQRIVVKPDRVLCDLALGAECERYTSKELIDKILTKLPSIAEHSCKNSQGMSFADVMNHTSVPHLLEHMVIDLQSQDCVDTTKTFVGTTKWIDECLGTATIEVSFAEDLSCLRAFCDATRILNNAMI